MGVACENVSRGAFHQEKPHIAEAGLDIVIVKPLWFWQEWNALAIPMIISLQADMPVRGHVPISKSRLGTGRVPS